MEIVIVICLFIIIVLLVKDKIVIKKRIVTKLHQGKIKTGLPDIMGEPKPSRSLLESNIDKRSQIEEPVIDPSNFDIKYDEHESVDIQIPLEELDEVFNNQTNFEEEEKEWDSYRVSSDDNSLALGVTIEELSSVGMLLQQDKLETSQKEVAVAIIQKLQGTELFSLLEDSIADASRKIAELLDSSLLTYTGTSSSMRNIDLNEFDIEDFV